MNHFLVEVSDGPIDLDRIARSGQMFRWVPDGSAWKIYDGEFVHRVELTELGMACQSRAGIEEIRSLFRLEQDHSEVLAEIGRRGPELILALQQMSGLRMMRPACARETLFSFLCSANNHVSRITQMVWKLSQKTSPDESGFRSIAQIAALSESDLRLQGFGYRSKTIPVVAKRLLADGGESVLVDLRTTNYEHARRYLLELPGIGPKLADCICLFAFDHQESVPIDTHIWQQLTRLYHPEWATCALTSSRYQAAADQFRERFGRFAGAAHQFLFVENLHREKTIKLTKNPVE